MKPEQWRLDLYQDLFSFAPYNSDLARAFIAIDHDEIPEEDDQGRRRVEGFKIVFEGVVKKGKRRTSERAIASYAKGGPSGWEPCGRVPFDTGKEHRGYNELRM